MYRIFRYLAGAGTDWYVSGPMGFNRYTRLNSLGTPTLVQNGEDVAIVETLSNGRLNIGYRTFATQASGAPAPNVPAASVTYETPSSIFAKSMAYVEWSASAFDFGGGTGRYMVGEPGVN